MSVYEPDCPFCLRVERGLYEETANRGVVSFEPLSPVTPGHRLFVPRRHVRNFIDGPVAAGMAVEEAARWAAGPANVIVSAGTAATQTVMHLHVHLVPRAHDDGLTLPWTGQQR